MPISPDVPGLMDAERFSTLLVPLTRASEQEVGTVTVMLMVPEASAEAEGDDNIAPEIRVSDNKKLLHRANDLWILIRDK